MQRRKVLPFLYQYFSGRDWRLLLALRIPRLIVVDDNLSFNLTTPDQTCALRVEILLAGQSVGAPNNQVFFYSSRQLAFGRIFRRNQHY